MNELSYVNEEVNMQQLKNHEEGALERKERRDNNVKSRIEIECQKYKYKAKKLKKKLKRNKKEVKKLRAYIDELEFRLQDTTSKCKETKKKVKLYKGIIRKERYYHNENPFEDISKIYKNRKKAISNDNSIDIRQIERYLKKLVPLVEKSCDYIDADYREE